MSQGPDIANYQNFLSFDFEKRKNPTTSCAHCQKAHLNCDGGRPCQGCIKRDLAGTCLDMAIRKKFKSDSSIETASSKELYSPTASVPFTPADQPIDNSTFIDTSHLFNFSLTDFGFGSETAGLEYGILGNMLVDVPSTTTTTTKTATMNDFFPFTTPQPTPVKKNTTVNTKRKGNTPEAVYNSVKKPFNYAEGFHYLIQYVTDKMAREDLMRISRALSLFRPSFLSLIMNLTEEDLVFMERCFQRTLLEYEKLISFSGTPTVVWRRTGEVCLVGKEFSLLTQWTRDMLLNKKTYIYELMENQSAVEYWEKFSTHAFDNTDKACSYSCILRTPQQKPVPCTFCFTIKRDIFDLPSVIVGNFLPILS